MHRAFSDEMIDTIAQGEARRHVRKQLPLMTFEEFVNQKQDQIDVSLKPVAVLATAPMEPVLISDEPVASYYAPEIALTPSAVAVTPESVLLPATSGAGEEPVVIAEELDKQDSPG